MKTRHRAMKSRIPCARVQVRLASALFVACAPLVTLTSSAQSLAPEPAPEEDVVELSPFEVRTDRDTSYGALNSNSLTRFSTELGKTPVTADIFTETFMRDVDAVSINDMLQTYGAGAGMVFATPSSDSALNQPGDRPTFGDRFTAPNMGVRGLSAGLPKRDGFSAEGTNTNGTDSWDVERVEVLRGPQGLLYGAAGAGGVINTTSKTAKFNQRRTNLLFRIDRYGSRRALAFQNAGSRNVAVIAGILYSDTQQRRVNIGDTTNAYYAQFAFRLPLRTTLRISGQYSINKRYTATGINVQYGSAAVDPRSGKGLGYLLATGQTGATNPATGDPYPTGPIANGIINWDNYASFGGNARVNNITTLWGQATLDTVWSKWLSTSFGARTSKTIDRLRESLNALSAPGLNGNPFPDDWAVSSNVTDAVNTRFRKATRASALTKFQFGRVATVQTAAGYDYEWYATGPQDYAYYLADTNGNVATDPSNVTNLGRTQMPNQWWKVGSGPVKNPVSPIGAPFYTDMNGRKYVRGSQNPRNPDWVSDRNPFGLASVQYPGTGISGLNWSDYHFQRQKTGAFWVANYTSWWDDLLTTLAGVRRTTTEVPLSGGNRGTPTTRNNSFNLGADIRIFEWLRGYYSVSSTFDTPIGFNDPVGTPPPTSNARGQEIGLKFSPGRGRISGSLSYYWTQAYKQNTNYGGSIITAINPTGINGTYRGPTGAGRNNWIPLDQKSNGIELIVTAALTKNWSLRFAATRSDGRILEDKVYDIIYNDTFCTDGLGNVTYKNGDPFMVPTTEAGMAALARISTNTNPDNIVTPATNPVQLTTSMMSNPDSPYYVYAGNPVGADGGVMHNQNGQINSGLQGTTMSIVGAALRFFNKPGVGTAFPGDPDGLGRPISEIQYDWDGNGQYVVAKSGEKTVGYPVYRISITTNYKFSHGIFKGLGFIVSANNSWQWRTYYYTNPNGSRDLYSQPNLGWQFNFSPYYERRLKKVTWRTQFNITNLFNRYIISLTPNNGTGYTDYANLGFRWDGQPRTWSWTNSFNF